MVEASNKIDRFSNKSIRCACITNFDDTWNRTIVNKTYFICTGRFSFIADD